MHNTSGSPVLAQSAIFAQIISRMPLYRKDLQPHFTFTWRGALALILGALVPMMFLGLLADGYRFLTGTSIVTSDPFLIVSNAVLWLGAIVAFDFFECRAVTGRRLSFNLSPMKAATYALVFPLMFGMMLMAEFISGQLPVTGPFFGPMYEAFSNIMEQMTQNTVTLVVLAVIMAPIFEEIVFRGIIQKGLINARVKPAVAIWVSAVTFGIVHANPWQFVGAVLLGYVLGLVYHRTNSLLMPILLHAFNNLLSVLLITYSDTESFSEAFAVSEYLILAVGIILFALFHFLFTKKYGNSLT